MPESRRRMVALCAAYCNVSGEAWLQSAITAAMMALAERDEMFSYMLVRASGAEWDSIEKLTS